MRVFTKSIVIVLLLLSTSAFAGPVLDDLLNYPVVDQKCPADSNTEGMGLISQQQAKFITLSKEQPLGQTFKLGPDADILWRICLGICHWPDSWQQGEEVTMTLYDSPAKTNKLYSRTIDFDHKWFKWDIAYDIHLPTKPNTEYYVELTHNGAGDNKINVAYMPSDAYPSGTAYVAGQPESDFDLHFVVITKPKHDRTQNLDRFISRFDMSKPEMAAAKAAMDKGDREGACAAILAWFDQYMKTADWVWRIDPKAKLDTSKMDKVCDQDRLYKDKNPDQWIGIDDNTTWREVWPGTSEYVRQNDLLADLGHAYAATHSEKYATKLNAVMADYIQDNNSPFDGGMSGGLWVAMHQAWRLGDAWDGVANAIDSKSLTADVKLAWLDYWARMAYFAMTEHSGGNQANAVAEAVMSFAKRWPVYKDSSMWFKFAWNKLDTNSLTLFREDGGCREGAMNYHGFSLSNLKAGIKTAASFGVKPSPELLAQVEKAEAYTAYMLKPNGTIPSYGDTDCEDFRPNVKVWNGWRKGEALAGAKEFGRSDLLYIATAGKQGTKPTSNSYRFPNTGHYILRSDWGGDKGEGFEDARWLFLRGGHSASHGHDDLNEITLYAYGRPLLIDPGRTVYGTPLMFELTANRSHNVLLVDDLNMSHPSPTCNAWHTTDVLDCVDVSYAGLYPGVEHRRAVLFARPDYYVMFDRATADKEHSFGINFWMPPPATAVDQQKCIVHTNDPDGSNILVQSIASQGLSLSQRNGTTEFLDKDRSDIPVFTFWQKGVRSAEFATLLYPFPKQTQDVSTREFTVENGRGCVVTSPNRLDIIAYCWADGKANLPNGMFSFEGQACLARVQDRSFTLIGGKLLKLRGITMASSDVAVPELCVQYANGSVTVNCAAAEPSLKIATMGCTTAVVNGKKMTISGGEFQPFKKD